MKNENMSLGRGTLFVLAACQIKFYTSNVCGIYYCRFFRFQFSETDKNLMSFIAFPNEFVSIGYDLFNRRYVRWNDRRNLWKFTMTLAPAAFDSFKNFRFTFVLLNVINEIIAIVRLVFGIFNVSKWIGLHINLVQVSYIFCWYKKLITFIIFL